MKKLVTREDLLEECFVRLVQELRHLLPGFGNRLTVDSTEVKAYANGSRKEPADPDARWGAKGASNKGLKGAGETPTDGGDNKNQGKRQDTYYWFGYKLHLVVDAHYELPFSFMVTPANEADTVQMEGLLKKAGVDGEKSKPEAVIADKGYDDGENHYYLEKKRINSAIRFKKSRTQKKDTHKAGWLKLMENQAYQEGLKDVFGNRIGTH